MTASDVGGLLRGGTRRTPRLHGICVVCRRELYRDPLLHFTSRAHQAKVDAYERRAGHRQPAGHE